MQPCVITKHPMHISETRINLTLINCVIYQGKWVQVETIETHRIILTPLESNYEVNSISHNKESTKL